MRECLAGPVVEQVDPRPVEDDIDRVVFANIGHWGDTHQQALSLGEISSVVGCLANRLEIDKDLITHRLEDVSFGGDGLTRVCGFCAIFREIDIFWPNTDIDGPSGRHAVDGAGVESDRVAVRVETAVGDGGGGEVHRR